MSSEILPLKSWQYVNDVKGATGQFTGVLGSTNQVNENPLAVDTLIQFCLNQNRTGVFLYSIDSSPFWNSGSTQLTAAGLAKLRYFVAQCYAQNLEVGIVWNAANSDFANALIWYNSQVGATEKITATITENEFWNAGNPVTALAAFIVVLTATTANLNTAGIDVYCYLGFCNVNAIPQLQGHINVFCFHNYTRIPNYAYCKLRVQALTSPQRVYWIMSEESPDDNATGGFDPANSYFDRWFNEGRDTSITPVLPNNPPPQIYAKKNLINDYQYITHNLTGTVSPSQTGSPNSYDQDTNANAVNNAIVQGIIDFAWRYTHAVDWPSGTPPPPPPPDLISFDSLQTPQACVLLRDILYTLINSPSMPANPQPTDYNLSTQECVLLYDILIALQAGGGGSTDTSNIPIDITVSEATTMNGLNSWVEGQLYNITNPPLPLKNYTARALYNEQVGQIRLETFGSAYSYDGLGDLYKFPLECGYDFSNADGFQYLSLYDPITNVRIYDELAFGYNISLYVLWGTWYDVTFNLCQFADFNPTGANIRNCYFDNTAFVLNNHTGFELNIVNSIGGNFEVSDDGCILRYSNIFNGNILLKSAGFYDNFNIGIGSQIDLRGTTSECTLNVFATLESVDNSNTISGLTIDDLSTVHIDDGHAIQNCKIGKQINMVIYQDATDRFCDGVNSNFIKHIDCANVGEFTSATGTIIGSFEGYGILLLLNNPNTNQPISNYTAPAQIYKPIITLRYGAGSSTFTLDDAGNFNLPSAPVDLTGGYVLGTEGDTISLILHPNASTWNVILNNAFAHA